MLRTFWVILVASLAVWLLMNVWTTPKIEQFSGGLRLLDMRFSGYTFSEAREFVAALGEEGVELYLGVQLWLDMIFPPLLGVVLFYAYRWLFPGWPGSAFGVLALASVLVDYMENMALYVVLRAGADAMTPEMVATAHQWTTVKWSFALAGLAVLFVGLALRLLSLFWQ